MRVRARAHWRLINLRKAGEQFRLSSDWATRLLRLLARGIHAHNRTVITSSERDIRTFLEELTICCAHIFVDAYQFGF